MLTTEEYFIGRMFDPAGFVHSNYRIDGTVTGRTSSEDPNLQNITRLRAWKPEALKIAKPWEKLEVRRCFIARGYEFIRCMFDYSQFELRMLAEYAREEFMLSEFERGADLHSSVAHEAIPGCPKDEKDPMFDYYRGKAKEINFGIVFGMGIPKLALSLDVPIDECVRLLETCQAWVPGGTQSTSAATTSRPTPSRRLTLFLRITVS